MNRSKDEIVNYLVKQAYLGVGINAWYSPTIIPGYNPRNQQRPAMPRFQANPSAAPEGYSVNPEWQKWHNNMPSAPDPIYSTFGASDAYNNYMRKEPPKYIPTNGAQQSNPYQNHSYYSFMPNNPFTGGPDYGKKWYQIMYDRFKSGLKSLIPSNPFRNPWKGTPRERDWYKYSLASMNR